MVGFPLPSLSLSGGPSGGATSDGGINPIGAVPFGDYGGTSLTSAVALLSVAFVAFVIYKKMKK